MEFRVRFILFEFFTIMNPENETKYYVKKKKSLLRRFDAELNYIKQILIDNSGEAKFNEMFTRTRKDFEEFLPKIPDVGGKTNYITEYLIDSALLLPLLRYFKKEELSFNEIGKPAYEIYEAFYNAIPATEDIFSDAII